ncbi:sigma-54 dependent transcriptional regulator [uncultured Azohydromonas sp.]|uniref:sigma-54 dependent transcriptional regulator n=1 Tax=uncultured Azohydromonas sp. TaxID=487342 RepID=UPI0026057045|nr:sigma-54 dependent transcriptional regulator [uncultured Azohydromonas sp.]
MDDAGILLPMSMGSGMEAALARAPAPQPQRSERNHRTDPAPRPRRLLCIGAEGPEALREELGKAGWQVFDAPDFSTAHRLLDSMSFLVGLLVLRSDDAAAWRHAGEFLLANSRLVWVALLRKEALKQPACLDVVLGCVFDHHHLPVDFPRLLVTLGHAYGQAALRQGMPSRDVQPGAGVIIGNSAATRRLLAQIARVADVDAPVLIQGESGTGKELAAQAIHRASPRGSGPFVVVNCGASQGPLLRSELFGHVQGAFPGAGQDHRGNVEAANGGTVFFDEIGDLPGELQASLLRLLQEGLIHRMGSTQGTPVDVRVIAATHLNLEQAVREGRFRKDLYYRLSVLPLQAPPLRERREDITLLAQHFYALYAHERRARLQGFSRAALACMQAHAWPGNVRELNNRVRRAVVMAEGRLIRPEDLGLGATQAADPSEALDTARTSAERNAICMSLQRAGHNVTQAARELGISRMTLYRLMAKHGIRG